MSKRDKAKTAREAARAAVPPGTARDDWSWLAEAIHGDAADMRAFMKKEHDGVALAERIAAHLGVELPMIEVMDFRKAGYLPEALLNYLALLGWSAGDDRERYTLDELAQAFTIERVNRTPARFDAVKLEAMNAAWMRDLPLDRLKVVLQQWFEVRPSPLARLAPDALHAVLVLFQSRARTLLDLERQSAFLRAAPRAYDDSAVAKHIHKGGGWVHLEAVRSALADLGRWEADSLERAFHRLTEESGAKLGKYAQPVRIAISGEAVTPPLFETLAVMDRDDVLARLERALEAWRPDGSSASPVP